MFSAAFTSACAVCPHAELAAGAVYDGREVRRWLATWARKAGRPRKTVAE